MEEGVNGKKKPPSNNSSAAAISGGASISGGNIDRVAVSPKTKGGSGGAGGGGGGSGGGGGCNSGGGGSKKPNKSGQPQAGSSTPDGKKKNKSGRRKRRKKISAGNGGVSGGGGGKASAAPNSSVKGPPQSPSIKITIRNLPMPPDASSTLASDDDGFNSKIETVIKNSRVVSDTLIKLIHSANERLNSSTNAPGTTSNNTDVKACKLRLDTSSLEKLIQQEIAAFATRQAWYQNDKEDKVDEDNNENTNECTNVKHEKDATSISNNYLAAASEAVDNNNSNGFKGINDNIAVDVRVLYYVAPKQTHRRGIKPGIAYLVLTAPPIPNRNNIVNKKSMDKNKDVASSCSNGLAQRNGSSNNCKQTANGGTQVTQRMDYSQDVARCRVMLQMALNSLSLVISSCTEPTVNGKIDCIEVEESRNAKLFRSKPDKKLCGTIFDTSDYKDFIQQTAMIEENIKARPRPTPGGGVHSALDDGVAGGATDAVPAIVLHLQQKQAEAKRKKQVKRSKAKEVKKKDSPVVTAIAKQGKSGRKTAEEKRKARRKAKRKKAKAKAAVAASTAAVMTG